MMKKSWIHVLCLLLWATAQGLAQPTNDECFEAIFIADPGSYCSASGEFTNTNATPGGLPPASCFSGMGNDVWFSFISEAPAVSISVIGNVGGAGTMTRPEVEIYASSDCVQFSSLGGGQSCSSSGGANSVQLLWSGISIGQLVYIRVQSSGTDGSFQLCIDNFFPPANPDSDCISGAVLCGKNPFVLEVLQGAGNNRNEAAGTCLDVFGDSEDQSTWLRWTADDNGTLEFTLSPIISTDDLDFVLFELPNGLNDCSGKISLRCNATFGGNNAMCGPNTGLREGEADLEEDAGCDAGENGFSAPINQVAGRSYALLINNFSQSGSGFRIDFGGTGSFRGPVPQFDIDAITEFECDKRITITNSSFSDVDTIVNYSWNFGTDASPATANTEGPHEIIYSSFGTKTIVLTVESSLGCILSESISVDIASCCDDFDAVMLDVLELEDNICNGDSSGLLEVAARGGNGPYTYTINDGPRRPFSRFENLRAGTYTIVATDTKGCEATLDTTITEPPPLRLDLGEDLTIELGSQTIINGFHSPSNNPVRLLWIDPLGGSLSCSDCFDPVASPTRTTTYQATIVDSMGCTVTDSIRIRVIPLRDIYIPDAFTPSNSNPSSEALNDFFTIYGGKDVLRPAGILELLIFNRWGDLLFRADNIPFGDDDETVGWDGSYRGTPQPSGVYVWSARIAYLDGVVIQYAGDVTLLR